MPNVIVKVGMHRKILEELLAKTQETVRIASPYVTDKDLLLTSEVKNVRLLTALSKVDVVIGATSLDCLQLLVERGVKCRVLKASSRLHAKLYIFDKDCAVVTSANLTQKALDKNIEIGVQLRRPAVARLINWFDVQWASEAAEPLNLTTISSLRNETAMLRRKFKKLRRMVPPESRQGNLHKEPESKAPSPTAYFLCNTDKRYDPEAENLMKYRHFAAAWEPFDITKHFKRAGQGDLILMYKNRVGIIAIGKAEGGYESLLPTESGRILEGDTPEWRIPVKWLRWVRDENGCPWKPHTSKTFVEVSRAIYSDRRNQVLRHFKVKPNSTA